MRIWNAVSTHLCYSQAEAKAKTTGYRSVADHYIKMFGSLSKSHSLDLQLWTMTKKTVYPKVASCNQQKVVLDTGQRTAAFLSTAQAAEEFHNLAQLTPSSYAGSPYICDAQFFTSPCSELAFFHQFFLCMSTDRACGNSTHCMWPAVQFHYANDNADNWKCLSSNHRGTGLSSMTKLHSSLLWDYITCLSVIFATVVLVVIQDTGL